MKRLGELCQPLADYRYKRINHLLPEGIQKNETHLPSDITLQSHIGCTPLVEAIKLEEFCQKRKEGLMKSVKLEQILTNDVDDNGLMQGTPPLQGHSCNPDRPVSTAPMTTPVSHISHTKMIHNSLDMPDNRTPSDVQKVSISTLTTTTTTKEQPNVNVPLSEDKRRRPLSDLSSASEEARKLRQAQQRMRKEEWQRKHKQKATEGGQKEEQGIPGEGGGGGGGKELITDGMYCKHYALTSFTVFFFLILTTDDPAFWDNIILSQATEERTSKETINPASKRFRRSQ